MKIRPQNPCLLHKTLDGTKVFGSNVRSLEIQAVMKLFGIVPLVILLISTIPAWADGQPKCKPPKKLYKGECLHPEIISSREQSSGKVTEGSSGDKKKASTKQGGKRNAAPSIDLVRLWLPWFQTEYKWMFNKEDSPQGPSTGQPVFDHLGRFNGDTEVFFWVGMDNAIQAYLGIDSKTSIDRDALFRKLSGLPYLQGEIGTKNTFGSYNPDMIRWAAANLVPKPDQIILGVSAKQVYDRIFFHAVRMYANTYIYLKRNPNRLSMEAGAYFEAMQNEDFWADGWLEERFGSALPEYENNNGIDPPKVFGFWIRRYLDGTSQVLADELFKLLKKFDPEFVKQHRHEINLLRGK